MERSPSAGPWVSSHIPACRRPASRSPSRNARSALSLDCAPKAFITSSAAMAWISIRFSGELVIEEVNDEVVLYRWKSKPWSSKKLQPFPQESIERSKAASFFRDMGLMRIPPMKEEP